MARPNSAARQLENILASTGMTVARFTSRVRDEGLEKHGRIVAFLKGAYGLTHGNANLVAHVVRDELAGGPRSEATLLDAQYAGPKAHLRPIYEQLRAAATKLGVDPVVQKTGVSFRRRKTFLVVRPASSKRVEVGLNLATTPADERVRPTTGMCSHRVDLHAPADVDAALLGWIGQAWREAE